MAVKTIPAIIRVRRGSFTQWQTSNPVLQDGEMGVVTSGNDLGKFKVGNGTTKWNDLNYNVADGISPQIQVVGTNTLNAGNSASVVNEGTSNDVKLRFSIPKGDKGDVGVPAEIESEIIVTTLNAGEEANAYFTGGNPYTLNIGIPKGDKGETGSYEDHTHSVYAPINNPTFTGVVTVANKTSAAANNGTLVATEAQVALKANLSSPAFTGTPSAPVNTDYGTQRIRNSVFSTTDLTAGTSALSNGNIYFVYE